MKSNWKIIANYILHILLVRGTLLTGKKLAGKQSFSCTLVNKNADNNSNELKRGEATPLNHCAGSVTRYGTHAKLDQRLLCNCTHSISKG